MSLKGAVKGPGHVCLDNCMGSNLHIGTDNRLVAKLLPQQTKMITEPNLPA